VRTHPAAAGNWLIDHRDDAAIARRKHVLCGLARSQDGEQLAAILLGVSAQAAALDPVLQNVAQRTARSHGVRRELVHFHVALVAEPQSLGAVVETQALRHMVERHGELLFLSLQSLQPSRYECEQAGETERPGQGDQKEPLKH
jgi:hypothetical protein